MAAYEFDHAGRRSRSAQSPEFGLDDAQRRLSEHTYRCMACLRSVSGYGTERCGVARQIAGQMAVFENAIQRNGEG